MWPADQSTVASAGSANTAMLIESTITMAKEICKLQGNILGFDHAVFRFYLHINVTFI